MGSIPIVSTIIYQGRCCFDGLPSTSCRAIDVPVQATVRASVSARSPWSEARRLASVGPTPALNAGGRLRIGHFDDRTSDRVETPQLSLGSWCEELPDLGG